MTSAVSQNIKKDAPALSAADFDRKSALDKLSQVRKVNDPRFGEIIILRNSQSGEFVAVQEQKFTDQKSAGAAVLAARQRLALSQPNLIKMLDYSVAKQSELCSTFYLVKYYWDYPKSDLKKESLDRARAVSKFTPEELQTFFGQQSAALDYLHENGQFHGDMQPLLIGYNPDNKDTKLIDRPEINNADKFKANQKNRFVNGQPLYVSPGTFNNLAKGNMNFPVNPTLEDSYGLGMSILELANQRPIQDVYNKTTKSFDAEALKGHIAEFNNRYGSNPKLLESVVGLTSVDENNRISSSQVTQYLVNGTNTHTVITRKIEALPMDGISLFDGIDTTLQSSKVEQAEPILLEQKVAAAVRAEAPPAPEPQPDANFSGKKLFNADDFFGAPQETTTTTTVTYQQPASNVVYATPDVAYNNASAYSFSGNPVTTTVYSSVPETYTTSYVSAPVTTTNVVYSSVPSESVVLSQGATLPAPSIISSNVTKTVVSNPMEISGLRLVRTYEDPTHATHK